MCVYTQKPFLVDCSEVNVLVNFFSGTGAAYSCHKPRMPSHGCSYVYSLVHLTHYELTFKTC